MSICLKASKLRGPLDTAYASTSNITVALGGTGSNQEEISQDRSQAQA